MRQEKLKLIAIGGSWGGIQATLSLLGELPENFSFPIVLVLHRQRNQPSELHRLFNKKLRLQVKEINEKEAFLPGYVYLAPANYHVLLENDLTFSLDSSEPVNFSRPAIDVTFSSAASVLGNQLLGILLSGASKDGSQGLRAIAERSGKTIIQDPGEAIAETMPRAAMELVPHASVMRLNEIRTYLLYLNEY